MQLQLILELREELNMLINNKEKALAEYDTIKNQFIVVSDNIQNMQNELKNSKNKYKNTIFNTSFKYTKYFGWFIGIILFIGVLISEGFEDPFLLILTGSSSAMIGIAASYLLSNILCTLDKFISFIIKKNLDIKKIDDKINGLINNITLNEIEIKNIEEKLHNAESNYKNKEGEINEKIKELTRLEDAFFSKLIGSNINNYNLEENIYCTYCKRKVKTIKDNK